MAEVHTDPIGVPDDDDGELAGDLMVVIGTILTETISAASTYAAAGTRLLGTLPEASRVRLGEVFDGVGHEIVRNQTGIKLFKEFGRELEGSLRRRARR